MKAIVYEEYGEPNILQVQEVEKPAPKEDEVMVQVHAASVNHIDWKLLRGESLLLRLLNGLQRPRQKILGDDIAGRVEAVGINVKRIRPGDEVFGISDFGAFAEYACAKEKYLGLKPASITFEEAAAVPVAGLTALLGLRTKGQFRPGDKVLIVGASGGVGTFAVQIAKSFGAEVTGVCSTSKLDLVRAIGADHVIDYKQEDFCRNGQRYDLILAAGGNHPISYYKRSLKPKGVYICAGGSATQFFQAMILGPLLSISGSRKLGPLGMAKPDIEDFALLSDLLESGKVIPVIDQCYPLSEVPEALRYYGGGHAQGKIVITVKHH